MEAVVFEDSPLAQYLEADGEAPAEPSTVPVEDEHEEQRVSSFAPSGSQFARSKLREKLAKSLKSHGTDDALYTQLRKAVSPFVHTQPSDAENSRFLEEFRYAIIASQLLNTTTTGPTTNASAEQKQRTTATAVTQLSLVGVVLTAFAAFVLVWIIDWVRGQGISGLTRGRAVGASFLVALTGAFTYAYVRRKYLVYLRQQAVDATAHFIIDSQNIDAAASTAIALIQEVELVSRGYRLSTPLPPISRLEDQSHTRRCARLRRVLRESVADALPLYIQTCDTFRAIADDVELERYLDIYEISYLDVQDAELGTSAADSDDGESLKGLKTLVQRLRTLRKVLLCCLLATNAVGDSVDFLRWKTITEQLRDLGNVTMKGTDRLKKILDEQENLTLPNSPIPKSPSTPGKERVRMQLRKLNALSQGVRGFQAKLHLLRETSEQGVDDADEMAEFGSRLMTQYESLGSDLKQLVRDWESGKSALVLNINKNDKRTSQGSSGVMSPASSIGGNTAVEGSPTDALGVLNGDDKQSHVSSADLDSFSDSEEVFEAIGKPRPRSSLTREERIAKMKEDRAKQANTRDKAQNNTRMLRELESVINLRPRARTGTAGHRITSI